MSKNRFITTQFCDDIRHEIGFKFSLMGCYSGELIVDGYPTALPKLCTLVTARSSIDDPFLKLSLRAKLNDEIIAELHIPDEALLDQQKSATASAPDGARFITVSAMMVFSPLAVLEESHLKIEGDTENGSLIAPGLLIRKRRENDPPTFPLPATS